jgi:hypothetical protein
VPASCANLGTVTDDLVSLGANGVLGVGNFIQDCGPACEVSGSENAGFYYSCPASGCAVEALSAAQQVSNPVYFFATDNNGVIVELPAVSGTAISITGSLIFGIGTQSNNGLGNATVVYTIDPNVGNFTTTFGGQTYTDAAYLDTGSNSIFFWIQPRLECPFAAFTITGIARRPRKIFQRSTRARMERWAQSISP